MHADQAHAASTAPAATPASQSISSGVMTYGGIRYTTLPIGRSSAPRVERVPVRAQAAPLAPVVALARRAVLHELDRHDHAGLPHLRDVRVVRERRKRVRHAARQRAVPRDHVLVAEDAERRERRRAGERIAGVAVRVQERGQLQVVVVEGLVHGLGGEHHRERQVAAGQSLRQAQEVRADARLLAGEERAGAAEADRDLVRDQQHAVAVAGLAQEREVHGVVHAHRARALHQRLDDDGGDLVRVLGQRRFHVREHAPAVRLPALARLAPVAVGGGHRDDVHQQRLVHLLVELDVADGERAERLAVVAVRERDEAALLRPAEVVPVVEAHLDRDLDRGRAVVGEEAAREARGREAR